MQGLDHVLARLGERGLLKHRYGDSNPGFRTEKGFGGALYWGALRACQILLDRLRSREIGAVRDIFGDTVRQLPTHRIQSRIFRQTR